MNKIVAILGIVVLITLGGLFFCAGFFTGSTMSTAPVIQPAENKADDKEITTNDVDAIIDTKSTTISEKIMNILSSAAETATSAISDATEEQKEKNTDLEDKSQINIDSLLREIAASHAENDNCSPNKTIEQINSRKPLNPNSLQGKKIIFVGYFKNKIALQVQQLLIGKGYKAHVETSKVGDENESFIFCGPFKKEKNAKKLVKWLRKHNFSEARLISISKEAIEETLYDFINEDSDLPTNTEKNIPPITAPLVQQTTTATPTPLSIQQQQLQSPTLPPIKRLQQPNDRRFIIE
ncbi:MAG: hypothetical protein LBS23_00975 [Holosporaceae bacterium]|jgi:hypothetical protein|nr:hypothetical protein [Holosporaceae bacterium]